MRAAAVCVLVGSILVAGCDRREEARPSQAGVTQPASAAAPASAGRPHPRAGLWRTSLSTNAGPGITLTGELCLDASTEDAAFDANGRSAAKDCEPTRFEPTRDGFAFTAVCHSHGRTITTQGVATGDFKTSYALDVDTHVEPAPRGLPPQVHAKMTATWAGPCRPGQKPGRVSMRFGGFG